MFGPSGPHDRHSPGNINYRQANYGSHDPPGLMFIYCPHAFLAGDRRNWDNELLAWKDRGFDGVFYRHDYIWILSPDPGCEL